MHTEPDPLVAELVARLTTTVRNDGDVAAEIQVVLTPASPLNLNVADPFTSPDWDCTRPPLLPPYPELRCTGPELEAGESSTLVTWSVLALLDGGESIVVELHVRGIDGVHASVDLPVLPNNGQSDALVLPPALELRRSLPVVRSRRTRSS